MPQIVNQKSQIANFVGKAIYNPSGKAKEYSYWACNFYIGCSGHCSYCYLKKGRSAKVLGLNKPQLKKCFTDENGAFINFQIELEKNITEIRKHGLFFTFTSDPFLVRTMELNKKAITWCVFNSVPVKILTKQTDWINDTKFIDYLTSGPSIIDWEGCEENRLKKIAFGFTLTGFDNHETGCSINDERIEALQILHKKGFKTWASIEPVIDLKTSLYLIAETLGSCDHYKIGLQSGAKHNSEDLLQFLADLYEMFVKKQVPATFYIKDSLLKQAQISREGLNSISNAYVGRDFNMFV